MNQYTKGLKKLLKKKTKLPPKKGSIKWRWPRKINYFEYQWRNYLRTGNKEYRPPFTCLCIGGVEAELYYIKWRVDKNA